jgi:hypothetical protein
MLINEEESGKEKLKILILNWQRPKPQSHSSTP